MFAIIKKIPVFIYDLFLSTFLTISSHLVMMNHMTLMKGNFMDVGCGTGAPLKKISPILQQNFEKIIGVDLHPEYTEQAKSIFKGNKKVQIFNVDFYKIKQVVGETKFGSIFFSFSFMLMPDPLKALILSKKMLKDKSSTVSFLMTIYKKPNPLIEKIKPIIRKITTVDFGKIIYQRDFLQLLSIAELQVIKFQRIKTKWNPFLWLFPVHYVECKPKNQK